MFWEKLTIEFIRFKVIKWILMMQSGLEKVNSNQNVTFQSVQFLNFKQPLFGLYLLRWNLRRAISSSSRPLIWYTAWHVSFVNMSLTPYGPLPHGVHHNIMVMCSLIYLLYSHSCSLPAQQFRFQSVLTTFTGLDKGFKFQFHFNFVFKPH